MFANRYTALVDACSLVSVWRRNLLLTLAEAEFFRVRWSARILEEMQNALEGIHQKRGHSDYKAQAQRAIHHMGEAFEEAMIEDNAAGPDYGLPDPNDEHILMAAIQCGAQALVTENLKDFPQSILGPLNIEPISADDFIADTITLDEGRAVAAIRQMRLRLKRPEMNAVEFLCALEAHRLFETASVLSEHSASL